jgi:uncharacterized protein DUF6882
MNPDEFAKFRHDAVHALMRLNESCEREFQISSWPRWDYDFDQATLTFSKDDAPRIVASIQVVGTTSENSGNWLWSWANQHLPSSVTEEMEQVTIFGERENVPELTSLSAVDDEFVGWQMTAIAARILGSKGAYRCPGENGFIYLVYSNLSFALSGRNTARAQEIRCGTHGAGYPGYPTCVCEHLVSNPAQVWFSDDISDEKRWPDAWCVACDAIFQEHGKTDKDESRIKIQLLCHCCYESLRSNSANTKTRSG